MIREVIKIPVYISVELLEEIVNYQKTHHITLVSQTIVIVLCKFFNTSVSCLITSASDEHIKEEKTQIYCLDLVTCQGSEEVPVAQRNKADIEELGNSQHSDQTDPSKKQESSDCQINNKTLHDVDTNPTSSEAIENPEQLDSNNSVELETQSTSTKISVAELVSGISGAMLSRRLQTNPTTLRKYLIEHNQLEWATQRDPDGLGWLYEPLLQRFYPMQINSDRSISRLIAAAPPAQEFKEVLTAVVSTNDLVINQGSRRSRRLAQSGGLRQVELARLTGIPTNTLQRWKQAPDCAERIEQRTGGCFVYGFSKHDSLFYPCTE